MIDIDKEFIGKKIKSARKAANLKQSELAEKIGLSEKHLSKIETAKNFPSLETFLKIIHILDIDLNDFRIQFSEKINEPQQKALKIILCSSEKDVYYYLNGLKLIQSILENKEPF